jgi:hypothetical protein
MCKYFECVFVQAALRAWRNLGAFARRHRHAALRDVLKAWRTHAAALAMSNAMARAAEAVHRFTALRRSLYAWRTECVGSTAAECAAVVHAAQFARHRGVLLAVRRWHSTASANSAARASGHSAAMKVALARARSELTRWRRVTHHRVLNRAFHLRNNAATAALVWRVWQRRAKEWREHRLAVALSDSANTARISRVAFAKWRATAREKASVRKAESHSRKLTLRRAMFGWSGWVSKVRVFARMCGL